MKQGGNHLFKSFVLGVFVIVLLLVAQFIPETTVGGIKLKKINILSDITIKEIIEDNDEDLRYADSIKMVRDSLERVHQEKLLANREDSIKQVRIDSVKRTAKARMDSLKNSVVTIEDYSIEQSALKHFYAALHNRKSLRRPVRIAFMGDSFTEGDIIVADVREQLQNKFGGRGIGFVPMASVVAAYTPTVKHTFDKWISCSILQKEYVNKKFTINGALFVPTDGAKATFTGVKWKQHLDSVSRARLLFVNHGSTNITVCTNQRDSVSKYFGNQNGLQQMITKGNIKNIAYSFAAPDSVEVLGVVLEDSTGIAVDNYSVRGNSGILMSRINKQLSNDLDKLMHYDLIVLQYGINAVQSDVTSYGSYRQSMVKVVNHLKECFPNTSFLLLGVGDRSTQQEGIFVTMPGIHGMLTSQKQIAQECGIAFWSIFDAMGGENSMVQYVDNNWASKDYTHISHGGGRQIGTALVKAILLEAEKYEAIYEIENNTNDEN
ncbi:MAG: hypothetical protein ACRDCN_12955 [Tannerellaceae bacterium]